VILHQLIENFLQRHPVQRIARVFSRRGHLIRCFQ
jgi:hypothetical protein